MNSAACRAFRNIDPNAATAQHQAGAVEDQHRASVVDAERQQAMVNVVAIGDEHAAASVLERGGRSRRAIAMSVSAIGRPMMNTGTSAANPDDSVEPPFSANAPRQKPIAVAPVSPRNRRAGWRL